MLQPESKTDSDVEIKYLKAQHVQWNQINHDDLPTMWATEREIEKFSVQQGDLLICEGGEVGRSALLVETMDVCIIQNALHRVRAKEKTCVKYLQYFMQHVSNALWFDILCNKATIAHLTGEKLAALEFPLPTLAEQQAIASFLDRKTAQIDELITKKEDLLKKLDEKRTALITRAVTKGLDPSAPMKDSSIAWLGAIPAHWNIASVHHITSLKSGESIIATMMDENEEFPVYGGNGFRGYFSNYTHDGNYILIGRQGALCGNINYASGKFWASEHAIVLTHIKKIISPWLGELLKTMNLNQYSVSAAQPGLSAEVIGRL
ncbi:MAG: restriction endonuclease subunit S [Chlorobium sp.]